MASYFEARNLGKRLWIAACATVVAAAVCLSAPQSARAGGTRTVLELFTSQGCSSCPPADALLRSLAEDDGVLTLSYPVDYWDYLGWKDTLASKANTQRQYGYAMQRGDRSVYTPQVVVNGRDHVVGSDRWAISRSIRSQEKSAGGAMAVDVDLIVTPETIKVRLDGSLTGDKSQKVRVWLVVFDEKETVPIGRGENRGKTITYTNIVRDMILLGNWTGKAATLDIARKSLKIRKSKYDHCAVIVQREDHGNPGEILGVSAAEPITAF